MKKKIHINRLGYMTGMPKSAVCSVTAGIFYLVDAVRGVSVYAGRLSHPFYDRESGDTVRLADFPIITLREDILSGQATGARTSLRYPKTHTRISAAPFFTEYI